MTNSEKKEWRLWWRFFVRRVREFGFVTAWVMMSWGLHSYIVTPFPLEGSPKYMFWIFEGVFDVYTLRELAVILIWPHTLPNQSWLRKILRARRISKAQKRRRGPRKHQP